MSITRVELAKRYIKKTKLINSGLKLVLDENNDTVILDGVIGNGDKLVIPEFINDINIRVGSNSKWLLSHNGPLNGSTYKEVKIECDLESYEYLFNGVVADKLVVDMSSCKSVKRLDLMFKGACVSSISVIGLEDKHIENMSSMFSYCKELEDVDISGINLKYVKSMDNLFEGCEMLERVNFGVGNTESLMYMSKMFRNCSKLSEIDISMLKKDKVTDMTSLFEGCKNLRKAIIGDIKSDRLNRLSYLFNMCELLEYTDINKMELTNVIDISYMFHLCENIKEIDISGISGGVLRWMQGIVDGCSRLEVLDMSGIDTTVVRYHSNKVISTGYIKDVKIYVNKKSKEDKGFMGQFNISGMMDSVKVKE